MIPAPPLLVAGLLVAAVLIYLVRRITAISAPLSAAVAIGFVWLVNATPSTAEEAILGGWVTGGEQVILGRTLALSPADRLVLTAAGLVAAVLFLVAGGLSWSPPPPGGRPARPGDIFFPGLLALLGAATAALVLETFVFGVLMVEVAAGVATALLQGTRFDSTRGAWRFFLLISLGMPFLLTAGWLIDTQAANPRQTELLNPAILLLTLGFAIYLSAAPFHLWMAPAAGEASPLIQVVVLGLFQMITLSVVMGAFEAFPWLASNVIPYQWFTFLGTLTAGLAIVLVYSSQDFGQVTAYNLLVDVGCLLLLMGLREPEALRAVWVLALSRMVSLTVWASGLAVIRSHAGSDRIAAAAGLGWQKPLAAALLILGGFSLAGFPLTPGFPARWMAIGLVARDSLGRAALLLLGSTSGVLSTLKVARTLFTARSDEGGERPSSRRSWLAGVVFGLLILGAALISVYPNPIIAAARQISSYFTFAQ
jgi:formate hydrogenlyase subunit 3/multisubunit Na+/H+ antiporter MnhD subunit